FDEDGVLRLLPLRHWGQAKAARRRDDVLLAYDTGDVGCSDAEPCHALRVEPDAHAVISGTEDANMPDTGYSAGRVVQVQQCEIAEKQAIVATLGRRERNHFEKVGGRLAYGDAVADNICRKLTLRDRNAVLNFDRVDVFVGTDVESHRQA